MSTDTRTCWADSAPHKRCHTRVPADPDHIGLCDRHLGMYRDPDYGKPAEVKRRHDGPSSPEGHLWARELDEVA